MYVQETANVSLQYSRQPMSTGQVCNKNQIESNLVRTPTQLPRLCWQKTQLFK